MTTAQHLLDVARSQLGYQEVPRNRTKYGRAYGMDGVAWCQIFIWWVCRQAGAPIIKTAYTPAGADWFQSRGMWLPYNSSRIKPGMVAYYYHPEVGRIAHTEFVERVLDNGNFISIGGNTNQSGSRTGGMVARQVRSRASVGRRGGFGVMRYEEGFHVNAADAKAIRAIVREEIDRAMVGLFSKDKRKASKANGRAESLIDVAVAAKDWAKKAALKP